MKRFDKKKFGLGAGMMVVFVCVMVVIFMPLFEGKNGLDYLDSLYNSISKGSANYIPGLQEANSYHGNTVELSLAMDNEKDAARAAKLLTTAGATATAEGDKVQAQGDLGAILKACLEDSERMFANDGKAVSERYGMDERRALHTWWQTTSAMIKDLNRQKKFAEAKFLGTMQSKAIECAYNYYRIEPQKIGDRWGIVVFSLLFYVIYTVWYGFAVLFMFEGAGFRLEAH